jgi:hypothetical protein
VLRRNPKTIQDAPDACVEHCGVRPGRATLTFLTHWLTNPPGPLDRC